MLTHPSYLSRLGLTVPAAALFAAWLAGMIALPIALWLGGPIILPTMLSMTVTLQAALVIMLLGRAWAAIPTLRTVIVIALLAWLAEAVGSATGLPFGRYHYTPRLQPQLAGVPLLIPLAWLMMLPPAWAVAHLITRRWSGPAFVAAAALAMTTWDMFLDPQMVRWDFWRWAQPGGYFGIPWLNFAGWLLIAALITALVRPRPLPFAPLFLIYSLTWLLETGGLIFFWGLPGPGLAGFAGMGIMVGLGWMNQARIIWAKSS